MPGTLINQMTGASTTLLNIQTGYLDRSGIAYDMAKHRAMPSGWYEVEGYKEQASFNDASSTRVFEGPWMSRLTFQQWALGSVYIDAADPTKLHRDIPCQHPEKPWLYCTDCELVTGQGVFKVNPNVVAPDGTLDADGNPLALGMIMYTDGSGLAADSLSCRMAVHYHMLDYDVLSDAQMAGTVALSTIPGTPVPASLSELDRFVIKTSVDSLQGLPLPGRLLQFSDLAGGEIPANAFSMLFPHEELTYIWKNVPRIPQANIDACMGKVNASVFDPNSRLRPGGYPAGTILCLAPHKDPHKTSQGLWIFDLAYRLLYRPGGHNNFPDASGTLRPAAFKVGGGKPFPPCDMNSLFSFS